MNEINYRFVALLTTDSMHDNITRFTLKSRSIRRSLFSFLWYKKQQDLKQRKRKAGKRCVVMFCNKTNADGVSLHQFPQTLDAGQYIWLLPATVHCNILQTFIFNHIHFLVKDVFFHPLHWLAVSTLNLVIKKTSKGAIFLTMLNRRNWEHNLFDCFHQK